MPRVFTPRSVQISVPVTAQIETYIASWNTVPWAGNGTTGFRIAGLAPITGELVEAVFIPDDPVTAVATKRWRIHVLNRGAGGTATTEMTQVLTTATSLTSCVPVNLTLSATDANLLVESGDVIVWRAVFQIDAGETDTNATTRPTGTLVLTFMDVTGS